MRRKPAQFNETQNGGRLTAVYLFVVGTFPHDLIQPLYLHLDFVQTNFYLARRGLISLARIGTTNDPYHLAMPRKIYILLLQNLKIGCNIASEFCDFYNHLCILVPIIAGHKTHVKTFDPGFEHNVLMYPFQDVIKEIMVLKNLSQPKIAKILGVDHTTVGQWLRGKKKPSYDSIMAIYEKFGIEPNVLFGIEK